MVRLVFKEIYKFYINPDGDFSTLIVFIALAIVKEYILKPGHKKTRLTPKLAWAVPG